MLLGHSNIEKVFADRDKFQPGSVYGRIAGAIIAVVGELLSRPLLVLTGAPAEVLELAVRYLRIYFVGSFFLMIYNFEAAILRASGDTRRPLYCLMFTGCVNIALNLFFVLVCKMNVEGVALATLAADILSAVLLFVSLSREKDVLRLDWRAFAIHADVAKEILLIGIPAAIQGMLFNIANIVIQSGINSLGADVVAASTIGLNMEVFAYYIVTGFGQAAITFNSQNLGAGQIRRCESATRWCLLLGAVFALATSFGMITCRDLLAGIFTSDPAIRQLAGLRITIVVGFEILNMVVEVLSGALRGLGHAFVPTALSILFVCVVRVGWLLLFFPAHHTFSGLLMVYPVSWALASTAISVAYFIIQKRLRAEG